MGTRLYPTTKAINKHLLPVYDQSMIMIPIETLKQAGITDITVSLSYDQPELFMKLLGKGDELGVNLTYHIHGEARGISYGINEVKHIIGDSMFVCILGDNYFTDGVQPLIDEFTVLKKPMVYLKEVEDPTQYGTPIFTAEKEIKKFVEKPKKPQNNYAVLGVYCLTGDFFKNYPRLEPSWRGEYEITDALNLLLPDVGYCIYEGEWYDMGTHYDLLQSSIYRYENTCKETL
jgi:glucose-1-phosphate thymidylyltransferase